jgi:plasmid stabilization system protein ParE
MAYRVEVTVRAARDLGSIYDYIRAENSLAAVQWFNGLEQAVYAFATMPLRCPIAPESKKTQRTLRHLLHDHKSHMYRAIYEVDTKRKVVVVLAVRHGAREPLSLDEIA